MKNLIVFVFMTFTLSLNAQDKAKAHFMRNTSQNGFKYKILVDKELKCELKNQTFTTQEIEPGKHLLQTALGKSALSSPLEVNFEAGKVYYFEVNLINRPGMFIYELQEVMESSGKISLARLTESKCK